ncbi:MAG: tRNA lysidine(34) synthetase TilS [Kiritimatiellia bacterium]
MPSALPQQVLSFIRRKNLMRAGQHVLVAVSGGGDSTALLGVLCELAPILKLRLTAAHLNHKIRGREAARDALFVRQLARKLKVGFAIAAVDVPRLAARLGISLEMAGRRARYDFLAKTARRLKCDAVATAHTADDSAESILIMLVRGCGSQGLTGIAASLPLGPVRVVRPFLETGRAQVRAYLRLRKLGWREDPTNTDRSFLRNRVRHELLPLLEKKYNSGIRRALGRLADVLRNENELIASLAAAILAEAARGRGRALDCAAIAKYPLAARRMALRLWLRKAAPRSVLPDFPVIEKLDKMLCAPGKAAPLILPGGAAICRASGRLSIGAPGPSSRTAQPVRIKIPGTTKLPGQGLVVRINLGRGFSQRRETPGAWPAGASLSFRQWRRRAIIARAWRPGDRMRPFGLKGSKKIQDIFSDAKIPQETRRRLPLFECGGEIVWIPGYRIAENWRVEGAGARCLRLMVAPCHSGARGAHLYEKGSQTDA